MPEDLHWFAESGQLEKLRASIEAGAAVDAVDEEGRTALHVAVIRGRTDVVSALAGAGADLEAEEKAAPGHRALHRACLPREYVRPPEAEALVRLLLDLGADAAARNRRGETPLHHALFWCGSELLEQFLAKGAPADAADDEGRGLIHVACRRDGLPEAEELLTGSPPGPSWTRRSDSALARLEDEQVLEILLAENADPNAVTSTGLSPLHVAAECGAAWAAKVLLAHDASLDAIDRYGAAPLHRARAAEVAELLVEHGANVDAPDRDGNTPLHRAIATGRLEVMDVLLGRGASPRTANHEGKTPLHVAASSGRAQTAEKLVLQGADVNARDQDGRTPLWAAEAAGHQLVVSTLKRHGGKRRPKRFLFFDLR